MGVGAVLVAAVLGLALFAYHPTLSTTSSVPVDLTTQTVEGSFSLHMQDFASDNVSSIVSRYLPNATVTWTGNADCFDGYYVGTGNITKLMDVFVKTAPDLLVGNLVTAATDRDGSVLVNSTFGFASAGSAAVASTNGTVFAQDTYLYSAATRSWLISQETWNFLTFNTSGFPCGTT